MIKLFYSAGSCSTSCHISLEESGVEYQAVSVDWDDPNDPNVSEVLRLNPLGTLPIAIIDKGTVLSQNTAIHTYIADLVPEKKLFPPVQTIERATAMNWISFVAADLHKSFSPLFAIESMVQDSEAQNELRNWTLNTLHRHLEYLNRSLSGKSYLLGNQFTVADAYCFVVTSWTQSMEIPISQYSNIVSYLERVSQRPAVKKVLIEEGLLEDTAA